MTREEKEQRIRSASGPFASFREILELRQQTRDDRLADADDEAARRAIESEYEEDLDRMINAIGPPQPA